MARRPAIDVGRRIGEFVLGERLGAGAAGVVHAAHQPSLGRDVVVKLVHGDSDAAVAAFLREAQLASRLDHPFAAHVYGYGLEPDGLLWLAMERVRGTPLDQILAERGALPLAQLVPVFDRLCEVVAAVHELGIVHRDLKPANVLIVARGGRLYPKLVDLGLAAEVAAEPPGPAPAPDPGPALVGSPAYMAPEQWTAPAAADQRADVYALGVLAYEALTGTVPFTGTLLDVARAHAAAPCPAVPAHLPAALDAVFARALAKAPGDRHATAAELAADLRAAAGFTDEDPPPALDPELAADTLARAPQPIADALAVLEAARQPHAARAAAVELAHAIAAWIGHVALAARAQLGGPAVAASIMGGDPAAITDRPRVTAGDWWALARALVEPFAGRAEVHPIPVLVERAGDPALAAALDRAIALAAGDAPADPMAAREAAVELIAALAAVLRALDPLFELELVVARGGIAEAWTGARRAVRRAVRVHAPLDDERPVLVDRDGAPVLALWPFVVVAAPAPGLAPELFLIEGRGPDGARLVAAPRGFERVDPETTRALRGVLAGGERGRAATGPAERAPYCGLAPFDRDDAAYYVGRERDVAAVVNRLRVQPLLAVVGPSGAGKTSFLQAGVLPALAEGTRVLVLRPGHAPAAALAALAAFVLPPTGEPTVIVVDQLEELFTHGADRATREAFAAALVALVPSADVPVRVLIGLRDDFLLRAYELPALRERLGPSLYLLGPPARDDLLRMLVEPARRAGYELETPEMAGAMVDEVAGRPGELPLLAFSAAQLWEQRDRERGVLPAKARAALGGVAGALAEHAERTLAALAAPARAMVREALGHLVTAEGTRAVLSRGELVELLARRDPAAEPVAEGVIERLLEARLITAAATGDGDPRARPDRIELIHEALIVSWPRLAAWRAEDAGGARLRDALRDSARRWDERGRPRGLLWRGDALLELELWRSRDGRALTDVEARFAAASADDAHRGRRIRRALALGAFVITVAAAAAIWRGARRADRERDKAEALAATSHERLVELHVEHGRLALIAGEPMRALAYLDEAVAQGGDDPALRFLTARAVDALSPPPLAVTGPAPAGDVLWARDRILVDAPGAALLDERGRTVRVLGGGRVHLAADATLVVRHDDPGALELIDARGGTALATLAEPAILDVALDPGARRVIACTATGAAAWTLTGGRPTSAAPAWRAALGPLPLCRLSPDGAVLVAEQERDGAPPLLHVLDAATGAVARSIAVPRPGKLAVAPGGRLLALAAGKVAELWELDTGTRRAALVGHGDAIWDVGFDPTGALLATASRDRTARLWETATGALARTLAGHRDTVYRARFSAEGNAVLTTSADGTARVWRAGDGLLLHVLHAGTAPILGGSLDATGARAAIAGTSAQLWELAAGPAPTRDPVIAAARAAVLGGGRLVLEGAPREAPAGAGRQVVVVEPAAGTREAAATPARQLVVVDPAADTRAALELAEAETPVVWDRAATVVAYRRGAAREAVVRDVATGAVRVRFGHQLRTLDLRDDGRAAVTVDDHGVVQVWDVATGAERARDRGTPTDRVWFAAGGWIVIVRSDPAAGLAALLAWQPARGAPVALGPTGTFYGVAACAAEPLVLIVGTDRSGRVWDLARRVERVQLLGHTNVTSSAAFDPACRFAATGSADGTVRVWEVASGRQLWSAELRATALAWSGDELVIVTPAGEVVRRPMGVSRLTPAELRAWTRCRVPFRVTAGRLEPSTPPESCRAPAPAARARHAGETADATR